MTTYFTHVATPIDDLLLVGDGERLAGVYMADHRRGPAIDPSWRRDAGPFAAAIEQLGEYFAGQRRAFDLPLSLRGTPFQQRIWAALARIPFGATTSYAQLAGAPGLARAAGAANGRNPISIVLPCHRVVGASGALTGYAGGVERKRWLLAHEASGH